MQWLAALVPVLALAVLLVMPRPHERVTQLSGELPSEVFVDGDVSGWVRMAPDFRGRAAIVVR